MSDDLSRRDVIVQATIEAIRSVRNPRFFRTERGYQGSFYHALHLILAEGWLDGNIILEMEYQKGARHGTSQRPDIILHIPVETSGGYVNLNNYAVWALKRDGNNNDALEDFDKLDEMFSSLNYPMGIFINIASNHHRLENYRGQSPAKVMVFAVNLIGDRVSIRQAYFSGGNIVEHEL